jgi:alanine racemase
MDQLLVDCGDDTVEAGDEVVLLGSQGQDRVAAEDLARWMGTIPYEIVCGVSERVPREYVG